jgi:hypothetical protein
MELVTTNKPETSSRIKTGRVSFLFSEKELATLKRLMEAECHGTEGDLLRRLVRVTLPALDRIRETRGTSFSVSTLFGNIRALADSGEGSFLKEGQDQLAEIERGLKGLGRLVREVYSLQERAILATSNRPRLVH